MRDYWYKNFDKEDKEIHARIQQLENIKPEMFWAQCDKCQKWRKLPFEMKEELGGKHLIDLSDL